jgi:hypothetical protein
MGEKLPRLPRRIRLLQLGGPGACAWTCRVVRRVNHNLAFAGQQSERHARAVLSYQEKVHNITPFSPLPSRPFAFLSFSPDVSVRVFELLQAF